MPAKKQAPASKALNKVKSVSKVQNKTVKESPVRPVYKQLDALKTVLSEQSRLRAESNVKYTTAPNKPGEGPLREYARYSSDSPSIFRSAREAREMSKLKSKRNRHASETF